MVRLIKVLEEYEYIKAFCFSEDGYRKGSDWEQLYDDLIAFGLTYEEKSSICFDSGDGAYQDIRHLSPGTQTNILIEYIVQIRDQFDPSELKVECEHDGFDKASFKEIIIETTSAFIDE